MEVPVNCTCMGAQEVSMTKSKSPTGPLSVIKSFMVKVSRQFAVLPAISVTE